MKITGITTEEYQWPRHKPIANGLHTYTLRWLLWPSGA